MNRTDVEGLLNQDDVLFLEIFRRAKVQMTLESENCSIPNDNVTIGYNESTSKESTFVDLSRNSLINSVESTKKKHLAFRKDQVGF